MATTIANLQAVISAETTGAQQGIRGVIGLLGSGGPLALAAVAAAAVVAGVGVAALHMAGDFQAGITSLKTGAGETQANLKMVSDGMLQMAVDTGTSTQQLTAGMFMIESAGYHGAAGLDVLKAAAEGAKVGQADLGTVADATTTVLKNYPGVVNGASGAVNDLIATVASGKTHMQDLAGAMANVLPTASAAGVSLTDVSAAMATMTARGVPAADAATYLRQLLIALDAPGSKAQAVLKGIGLTAEDVSEGMKKSLPDTLQLITSRLAKEFPVGSAAYVAALKDISGGSRQMQGMLNLTGGAMQDFQADVVNITGAVTKGGKGIAGWSDVQGDFNFKISRAKEVVETLAIKVGTGLLPAVGDFVTKATNAAVVVGDKLTPVLAFLGEHGDEVKTALVGLGIGIAVVLVPAMITWAGAAWAAATGMIAAAAPVLAIVAGVALLVLGLKLAYDHFGWFHAAVDGARVVLGTLAHFLVIGVVATFHELGDVLGWLGDHFGEVFGHIGDFVSFVRKGIEFDSKLIGDAFSGLGSLVHDVWTGITSSIRGEVDAIIDLIDGFIDAINRIKIDIPKISLPGGGSIGGGSISFPHIPDIPHLATGGDIAQGGLTLVGERGPELAYLPAGARVYPHGSAPAVTSGAPVHVHVHVAGREITKVLLPDFVRAVRTSAGLRQ